MKKEYIIPVTECVDCTTENLMAASLQLSEEEVSGTDLDVREQIEFEW